MNYYGKYLPDLTTVLNSFHRLLHKCQQWKWDQSCEDAFRKVKELVTSEQVPTHYDPEKPIKLAFDASTYGIGVVISHIIEGHEKPIDFASPTLNPEEKNFVHINKEALGLIWGIKKFHTYLHGRKCILETDHQPLVHIFKPEMRISSTASARIQRYATFLSGYEYEIVFRKTEKNMPMSMFYLGYLYKTLKRKSTMKSQSMCFTLSKLQICLYRIRRYKSR